MSTRRNVLFIIIDQLRADVIHGALGEAVALPHLRAFSDDATSFRSHYSVTNPCGPSRASILTGQYAMNHGSVRNGTPLAADTPNLATEMRKLGYLPLLFGYTDVAADPRAYHPNDPHVHTYEQVLSGFSEVCEMRLEESWPWRAHLLAKGYDVPPYPEVFRPAGDSPDAPAFYRAEDSDTAFLTDRLLMDLPSRAPGWFAHLTWIRPHPPLVAPAPYNTLVSPDSLPAPTVQSNAHPYDAALRNARSIAANVEGFPDLGDDATDTLRALYLGLAAEVDHHFGRIIAFLKDTGQYDSTRIVVTADHGEMLGDQALWGKMTYHDAAFHTPLMIRDPDLTQAHGRVVTQPTESIDITPTLLDLSGATVPDDMDGRSLRPFLSGETPQDWRRYSYSELDYGNPLQPSAVQTALGVTDDQANMAILRGSTHSYVHFNGTQPCVLFDHTDAGEAENIADTPEAQPILLSMAQSLLDHRMTHRQGRFAKTLITSDGPKRQSAEVSA